MVPLLSLGILVCVGLIILVIIILIIAFFLKLMIAFLPATLVAILVFLVTWDWFLAGISFVVVALILAIFDKAR